MRGRFTLKHDPYTSELCFCNLPEASLGFLRGSYDEYDRLATLIAHDVVEHSTTHRNKDYVTYESEIRALGASAITRPGYFDLYNQVLYQCMDMERSVKRVPYIVGKYLHDVYYVDTDMMRYLIKEGIEPSNARNAVYHFEWGQWQKSRQFSNNHTMANIAFRMVEDNIIAVLKSIDIQQSYGASVYFDTDRHIFRYQMKRQ